MREGGYGIKEEKKVVEKDNAETKRGGRWETEREGRKIPNDGENDGEV